MNKPKRVEKEMIFTKNNRRTIHLATIAPGLLLLLWALVFCACSNDTIGRRISKDNVTVRQVGLNDAHRLGVRVIHENDWFIETPGGTLVVAGKSDNPRTRHLSGTVTGIVFREQFSDNLTSLSLYGEIDNTTITWNLETLTPKIVNGSAGIAMVQVSADHRLTAHSFIHYAKRTSSFKIWTQITNTGAGPIARVAFGSTVVWDGGFVFSPGRGFIEEEVRGDSPWLAMKGKNQTTGLVLRDRPYSAQYRFDPHGPYENKLIAHSGALAPGARAQMEQHILINDGGIEKIAARAWDITGIPTGRISGTVSPMLSWGEIAVQPTGENPQIVSDVSPDGTFDIPIPFGNYEAVLITPGGKIRKEAQLTSSVPHVTVDYSTRKPGVLHFLVSDETLLPIPTRLIVRGVPPTENPMLGPRYNASGAENIIYSERGAGSMELPEGQYRVTATHGPEFSISEEEITVKSGRHVSISHILREEIERKDWLSADFHLHAEPSHDSNVSLTDRVISLYAENVDIAVATDHNVVGNYENAIANLQSAHGLRSGTGVEVTTQKPNFGHFNVWPVPADEPPPQWTEQTPSALFASVRSNYPTAIIQVNHPRMDYYDIGYFTIAGLNLTGNRFETENASFDFDVIEVYNGMNLKHPELVEQNLAEWYQLLNLGYRFTVTGNSDSHFLSGHFVGYPRNYLHIPSDPPEAYTMSDVADTLKAGHSFVSTGPFMTATLAEGTFGDDVVVKPNHKTPLDIQIQSASWLPLDYVTVIVNGEEVATAELEMPTEPAPISISFPLVFQHDSWVVIKTGGSFQMNDILPGLNATPLAFSNPIWVHVGNTQKR
ncbi:MAG: PHP domain-containing protein [Deltaproteobacteria bacterium]|nr:PHP domain-containing protein [Deltaproteobacteria bacterium]MBN2672673.1 PHP domain-containing protein [Deltaproteobacteria bacterium]